MKQPISALLAVMTLSGCSFNTQVQRFGVEYNEALASMANEQTFLNILRTSYGMPAHFSSVSRFNGSLAMKGSASVGGQLRGTGISRTDVSGSSLSTATTVSSVAAPTGTTTTNTLLSTPGSTGSSTLAAAEGVDLYTPQIGGELSSGTGFEVQVFDQQKFYQGILSAVPFTTVEMLINQGFEPDLVATLLIARVDFYVEDAEQPGSKRGEAVASYRNERSDRTRFQDLIDCNELIAAPHKAPDTKLVPISRLNINATSDEQRLTLGQLSLFESGKFGISSRDGISPDGSTDNSVYVIKPGSRSREPRLLSRSCPQPPLTTAGSLPEATYLNDYTAMSGLDGYGKPYINARGVATKQPTKVVVEITFRSPEAVLRAVGEYVRAIRTSPNWKPGDLQAGEAEGDRRYGNPMIGLCADGTSTCPGPAKKYEPIFEIVPKRTRSSALSANFMGADYAIPSTSFRSMQVISIIQQLINLQKESSERALSVPVRATQ